MIAVARDGSYPIEIRITATGSTDAADKAKAHARRQGYRIRTVASVKLASDAVPPGRSASPRAIATQPLPWVVTLAVRRPA